MELNRGGDGGRSPFPVHVLHLLVGVLQLPVLLLDLLLQLFHLSFVKRLKKGREREREREREGGKRWRDSLNARMTGRQ